MVPPDQIVSKAEKLRSLLKPREFLNYKLSKLVL
jgi:hypothetical protein